MTFGLRKWATPLTFATFAVTGVTGVVLFFHAGGTLSRVAHEWIGMAIMGVVILHVVINWRPFKAYLTKPLAGFIMALGLMLSVVTSVNLTASQAGGAQLNPGMVFGALQRAPVSALAAVAGRDPATFIADLNAAGYVVTDPGQSVTDIAGGDAGAARVILARAFAEAR